MSVRGLDTFTVSALNGFAVNSFKVSLPAWTAIFWLCGDFKQSAKPIWVAVENGVVTFFSLKWGGNFFSLKRGSNFFSLSECTAQTWWEVLSGLVPTAAQRPCRQKARVCPFGKKRDPCPLWTPCSTIPSLPQSECENNALCPFLPEDLCPLHTEHPQGPLLWYVSQRPEHADKVRVLKMHDKFSV